MYLGVGANSSPPSFMTRIMPVLAQPSEDRLEGTGLTGLAGSGPQGEVGVSLLSVTYKSGGAKATSLCKGEPRLSSRHVSSRGRATAKSQGWGSPTSVEEGGPQVSLQEARIAGSPLGSGCQRRFNSGHLIELIESHGKHCISMSSNYMRGPRHSGPSPSYQ